MWPFKSKFDKLTREDVVKAICDLENEAKKVESDVIGAQAKIDELIALGKKTSARELKLFYAKKINEIIAERQQNIQQAMFLMYNIGLLNKLKRTIDNNQFFKKTSGVAMNKLLSDQRGLAVFLNKSLNNRIKEEAILTDADEIFKQVEESYYETNEIYGQRSCDNDILAQMEISDAVEEEVEVRGVNENVKSEVKMDTNDDK